MNKPKPLKDKTAFCFIDLWRTDTLWRIGDDKKPVFVHLDSEIKSAVEWLEQELNALFQISGTDMDDQEEIIDKIKESFEDVIFTKEE